MADFFGDIFSAVTGQQATPQQTIIPTNELLGQAYGSLSGQVAPGLLAFNQALAPGLTDVQLGVANQIDPSILANFRGANQSILDQLNLGSSMSPELQAEITRNLLATNAATGFGASAGGVGNVLYQTASDKENLRQSRVRNALGAGTSGLGVSKSFYDPLAYTQIGLQQAGGIAQDIRGVQAAKDEAANLAEDIRRQNFSSLLNTGGRIAGTVAGGIFGGAGGAALGGSIGGNLISGSRVAGRQSQAPSSGGGNFLSSLMGMFGGGGAYGNIGSSGTGVYTGGEIASGTGIAGGRSV